MTRYCSIRIRIHNMNPSTTTRFSCPNFSKLESPRIHLLFQKKFKVFHRHVTNRRTAKRGTKVGHIRVSCPFDLSAKHHCALTYPYACVHFETGALPMSVYSPVGASNTCVPRNVCPSPMDKFSKGWMSMQTDTSACTLGMLIRYSRVRTVHSLVDALTHGCTLGMLSRYSRVRRCRLR